jgi:hypothetical protein
MLFHPSSLEIFGEGMMGLRVIGGKVAPSLLSGKFLPVFKPGQNTYLLYTSLWELLDRLQLSIKSLLLKYCPKWSSDFEQTKIFLSGTKF